uniref:Protein kinase domain-containing protein n=1 Tax=Macrostomum lignano TaxID=282301 RepID=A0A1I8FKR1_9PLAT
MSKQLEFIKQLISRKGKCYDVAKRQKSFEKELAASDRFQLMTDASQPGSAEQPPTAAQQPPGPAERPKSHAGRSTFAHSIPWLTFARAWMRALGDRLRWLLAAVWRLWGRRGGVNGGGCGLCTVSRFRSVMWRMQDSRPLCSTSESPCTFATTQASGSKGVSPFVAGLRRRSTRSPDLMLWLAALLRLSALRVSGLRLLFSLVSLVSEPQHSLLECLGNDYPLASQQNPIRHGELLPDCVQGSQRCVSDVPVATAKCRYSCLEHSVCCCCVFNLLQRQPFWGRLLGDAVDVAVIAEFADAGCLHRRARLPAENVARISRAWPVHCFENQVLNAQRHPFDPWWWTRSWLEEVHQRLRCCQSLIVLANASRIDDDVIMYPADSWQAASTLLITRCRISEADVKPMHRRVPRMLLRRPGSDSVWSSASVTAAARAALSGSESLPSSFKLQMVALLSSDAKDSQLIAGLSGYDRRAGLLYDDVTAVWNVALPSVVSGLLEPNGKTRFFDSRSLVASPPTASNVFESIRLQLTPLSISRSVAVDVRLDERQSISLWRQAENLTAAVAVLLLTLLFPGDDVHFPGAYGFRQASLGKVGPAAPVALASRTGGSRSRFVLSGFYDSGLEISSFERSGLLQGFAESDVRRLQEPAAQLIRLAAGDDLISDDRITLGLEFAALCCLEQALNPCVDRLARLLRAVPEFVTHEHGIVPAAEVSLQGVQELVKSPAGIRKFCVGFGDLLAADVEQNFVLLSRVLNAACSDEALETVGHSATCR